MKVNNNLDLGNAAKVVNVPAPTAGGDAANKAYVDALKSGLAWLDPVRAASTANVNLAGPGAAIDGVNLADGDRVLLKNQATASENGVWVWHGAGAAMVRAADGLHAGSTTVVDEGNTNADTVWLLATNDPINVGATALAWTQIGQIVTAGTGLDQAGNTISLHVPVAVASGGTGATTATAARGQLGAVGKYAQDFGDGAATSFDIAHGLNSTDVHVTVYLKATNAEEFCDVTVTDANHVHLSGWSAAPAAAAYRVVVLG